MENSDATKAQALIRDLSALRESHCVACGKIVCSHEALLCVASGFKDEPRCCACLAVALNGTQTAIRDRLFMYIYARPCFQAAWNWASEKEGFAVGRFPNCLWPAETSGSAFQAEERHDGGLEARATPDAEWDAGEIGCGDLVLQLRIRLNEMPAKHVLKVIARDPGAPEDLPAWCRLTGHHLVLAAHPEYLIQRKEK